MLLQLYRCLGLLLGITFALWNSFSTELNELNSIEESDKATDNMKDTVEKYKKQYLESINLDDVFQKIIEQNKDVGLSLNKKCLVKMFTVETYWDCVYNFDELDENYKISMALGLTMCQLINNNIEIPYQCNSMNQLNQEFAKQFSVECLKSLFEIPQYWTTYDGYYKFLSFGCTRISNQYETLKMKELFLNITKNYNSINYQLVRNLDKFKHFEEKLMEELIELFKINFLKNLNEEKTIINKTQDFFLEVFQENENVITDYYQDLKLKLYQSFVLNQIFLNESIQVINTSLLELANDIEGLNQKVNIQLNSTMHNINTIGNRVENFLLFFLKLNRLKNNFFRLYLTVWNNILAAAFILLDYIAYFLIGILFLFYVIRQLINKILISIIKIEKKIIFKKIMIFLAANIISYLIGRSLVYCLKNFIYSTSLYSQYA